MKKIEFIEHLKELNTVLNINSEVFISKNTKCISKYNNYYDKELSNFRNKKDYISYLCYILDNIEIDILCNKDFHDGRLLTYWLLKAIADDIIIDEKNINLLSKVINFWTDPNKVGVDNIVNPQINKYLSYFIINKYLFCDENLSNQEQKNLYINNLSKNLDMNILGKKSISILDKIQGEEKKDNYKTLLMKGVFGGSFEYFSPFIKIFKNKNTIQNKDFKSLFENISVTDIFNMSIYNTYEEGSEDHSLTQDPVIIEKLLNSTFFKNFNIKEISYNTDVKKVIEMKELLKTNIMPTTLKEKKRFKI